jgi:hypothetical protein
MQNMLENRGKCKTNINNRSLSLQVSTVALGITPTDLLGLTARQRADRLRKAAVILENVALELEGGVQ